MNLSVIIPVLNGEEDIANCIQHLISELKPDEEIIVVDNGSTDNTHNIVRSFDRVKLFIHPEITIAALRNTGAEHATGNTYAFIDSDVIVCPGWRQAIENVLEDNSIKATGSICSVPDDATWIEKAWWSFTRPTPTRVNYINSGNFIIRSDIFNELNGFSEALISDEDSDIGLRLNQLNYYLLDDPKIKAIHLGNAKTFSAFIKKERWHATSIVEGMITGIVDKAMIMTFLFMFLSVIALLALPLSIENPSLLIPIIGAVLFVPVITSLFRALQYKNYSHFFSLIILYLVFYYVRSIVVIKDSLRLIFTRKK